MSETNRGELSQDTIFDLLSSARRRYTLWYLHQQPDPVHLQDLAEEIAAWENDTEPENLTDQDRKRVYVSLYQTHIPKLEEAGVIEYDGETGEIRLVARGGELGEHLGVETTPERRWELYYLALAAAGVVVYGVVALFFGGQFTLAVLGLLVLSFGLLAAAHYATSYR